MFVFLFRRLIPPAYIHIQLHQLMLEAVDADFTRTTIVILSAFLPEAFATQKPRKRRRKLGK